MVVQPARDNVVVKIGLADLVAAVGGTVRC
jgi:hypothetical protein